MQEIFDLRFFPISFLALGEHMEGNFCPEQEEKAKLFLVDLGFNCSLMLHFSKWSPFKSCSKLLKITVTFPSLTQCFICCTRSVLEMKLHRWASTSILMSAISDIRHPYLLFRRQIFQTEKLHSDIGSVLISTSEFISISDSEEIKFFLLADSNPCPLEW
jgi:hypothetical protein